MAHTFITLRRLDQAEHVTLTGVAALASAAEQESAIPEVLSPYGAQRPQRDDGLIRQFRADQVETTPEQDVEAGGFGAAGGLTDQSSLADARVARDQDGRARTGRRGNERGVDPIELALPTDEGAPSCTCHSGSIAQVMRSADRS
jgi:hypothetical protein